MTCGHVQYITLTSAERSSSKGQGVKSVSNSGLLPDLKYKGVVAIVTGNMHHFILYGKDHNILSLPVNEHTVTLAGGTILNV